MGSFYCQLALPGLESPGGGTSISTLIVVGRLVLIVVWVLLCEHVLFSALTGWTVTSCFKFRIA